MHYSMYNLSIFKVVDLKRKKKNQKKENVINYAKKFFFR